MTTLRLDERGFGTAQLRWPWTDLRALGVRTTSDGPWGDDVFWVFLLSDRVFEVPGSQIRGEELEVLQQQLPGLDNEKLVRAMGSVDERMFRLWHPNVAEHSWEPRTHGARFAHLVVRLGGDAGEAAESFERLSEAYNAPHRRYHNLTHLAECLQQLDAAQRLSSKHSGVNIDLVELALWFHDAVYEPLARDNEARSAALLLKECEQMLIPEVTRQRAAELVRTTEHGVQTAPGPEVALRPEAALLHDVDLAILAADPLRFEEYEQAIAEEFAAVSGWRFRLGRGRFLASLLARGPLFLTEAFQERYEQRARAQLSQLLHSPRYRIARFLRWL